MITNAIAYEHPMLIDGERYLLNKNPFEYAEEAVLKYWPEKVERVANELLWEEFQSGKTAPSLAGELTEKAAKMLATEFLADEKFFKYYKQDGYDMMKELKPLRIFPVSSEQCEEERELA